MMQNKGQGAYRVFRYFAIVTALTNSKLGIIIIFVIIERTAWAVQSSSGPFSCIFFVRRS